MTEISYEFLFNILRQEKSKEELQQLDKDFYKDVIEYVRRKQTDLLKQSTNGIAGTTSALKNSIEFHNIKKVIKELYERRERKIVAIAINKIRTGSNLLDTSVLLQNEHMLFTEIVECLKRHKNFILSRINAIEEPPENTKGISQTQPDSQKEEQVQPDAEQKGNSQAEAVPESSVKVKHVRFTKDMPSFLGLELETLGPYKKGDEAELAEEIVRVLKDKDAVEIL